MLWASYQLTISSFAVSARKKKEKKSIFLPLLILFKVFKLKIMVHMVLVGVIIIKKMLLAAAIFLPGALAAIKAHCKQQQFHVVPYHVDEDHYTHSHEHEHEPSGFGASGFDDDKHFWAHKKKYSHL
ncbi:hypothetical protein GEV33_003156 [Tenebrio molitor]|uniref:Uncharacterized protein n=1 Tax=Tenebrio molitor TaxID=7067 RepID=A0A8J6LFI7_TENMO|nr:hypothetical protein GEV33_003156 [Tenebrio molitor]